MVRVTGIAVLTTGPPHLRYSSIAKRFRPYIIYKYYSYFNDDFDPSYALYVCTAIVVSGNDQTAGGRRSWRAGVVLPVRRLTILVPERERDRRWPKNDRRLRKRSHRHWLCRPILRVPKRPVPGDRARVYLHLQSDLGSVAKFSKSRVREVFGVSIVNMGAFCVLFSAAAMRSWIMSNKRGSLPNGLVIRMRICGFFIFGEM